MSEEDEQAQQELVTFVVQQLQEGKEKLEIVASVREMGVDWAESEELVESVYDSVAQAVEGERVTLSGLVLAIMGGGVAAVVGGIIWALIVIAIEYEIGFMALGLGLLSGFSVLVVSMGKRGIPFQLLAVISSVLGIVIGKYLIYVHFLKIVIEEQFGTAAASSISRFSGDVIDSFIEDFSLVFSGWDILWVALAVYTAWKMLSGTGLRLPGTASPP